MVFHSALLALRSLNHCYSFLRRSVITAFRPLVPRSSVLVCPFLPPCAFGVNIKLRLISLTGNVGTRLSLLLLLLCAGQVLVQEFLVGTEYVVDTVSRDGEHKVMFLFHYDRRALD